MTFPADTALSALEFQELDAASFTPEPDRPAIHLTGRQKVALVVAQLGPKKAAPILKEMSDEDAIELTTEIANLPALDNETVVEVLGEFVGKIGEPDVINQGGLALAREFLQERLGQARASEVLDEMEAKQAMGPLASLASTDPRQVVSVLVEQQPQTVAVLLAYMRPEDAARIITELPHDFRTKVARRIGQLEWVDPAAVRHATTVIESKLRTLNNTGSVASSANGAATIAEILNFSGRSTEKQIMGELESQDSELAAKIKANLFTFDDAMALEDKALQQILRRVTPATIATALKGDELPADLLGRVKANLTERAVANLEEELEVQINVKTAQIDAAQAEIVKATRELDAEGIIVITKEAGAGPGEGSTRPPVDAGPQSADAFVAGTEDDDLLIDFDDDAAPPAESTSVVEDVDVVESDVAEGTDLDTDAVDQSEEPVVTAVEVTDADDVEAEAEAEAAEVAEVVDEEVTEADDAGNDVDAITDDAVTDDADVEVTEDATEDGTDPEAPAGDVDPSPPAAKAGKGKKGGT